MSKIVSMGVINLTPDSFSDGLEVAHPQGLLDKLHLFKNTAILDFGAESTAPMNKAISFEEELKRFGPYLDLIFSCEKRVSIDSYHPETIFFFQKEWLKRGLTHPLIWNDVSGKFDDDVQRFLQAGTPFEYIFCHNLAPTRDLSSHHMDYTLSLAGEDFLHHLVEFFQIAQHEQVILDPCLGFSKNYQQNWWILEEFSQLQKKLINTRWVIGFSRKSFLRQKYGLTRGLTDRDKLDELHLAEVQRLSPEWKGEVWLRTHRPELL